MREYTKVKDAIEVVKNKRQEILDAYARIEELQNDPEWKKAIGYLKVAKTRCFIDVAPSKKNGYQLPQHIVHKSGDIEHLVFDKKE